MLWEVAKRSAANWRHGSSTPTVVLTEPPSLPATFFSRSDCDWTGVPLFSLWVMAKSGAARYFESVKTGSPPFIARCHLAGHGVPLHTLMLITITKRKYLANEYSVVKEQSRFRHTKENRARVFVLSPCSPWEYSIFPSTQITFLIFLWAYPFFCKLLFQ